MPRKIEKAGLKPGATIDVTYPAKFSENTMDRLRKHKAATGVPMTKTIREAVDRYLSEYETGPEAEQEPAPNRVSFDLEPAQYEVLNRLSVSIGIRSINDFAQHLVTRIFYCKLGLFFRFFYAGFERYEAFENVAKGLDPRDETWLNQGDSRDVLEVFGDIRSPEAISARQTRDELFEAAQRAAEEPPAKVGRSKKASEAPELVQTNRLPGEDEAVERAQARRRNPLLEGEDAAGAEARRKFEERTATKSPTPSQQGKRNSKAA